MRTLICKLHRRNLTSVVNKKVRQINICVIIENRLPTFVFLLRVLENSPYIFKSIYIYFWSTKTIQILGPHTICPTCYKWKYASLLSLFIIYAIKEEFIWGQVVGSHTNRLTFSNFKCSFALRWEKWHFLCFNTKVDLN